MGSTNRPISCNPPLSSLWNALNCFGDATFMAVLNSAMALSRSASPPILPPSLKAMPAATAFAWRGIKCTGIKPPASPPTT